MELDTHPDSQSDTRISCRPDGCAGLCTDAGLRAADTAYRRMLIARARRVLGDPALAEEAAQEALVRAWRSCASFDPAGGPVRAWLLTIVHHVAVDLARARARRPPVSGIDPGDAVVDAAATHEDTVVLRDELLDALSGIGPVHRHVVIETVLRDRSHVEVAAELGIPAGTVRSRLHYALRQLRAVIEAPVCPA
jgi:RNA polymerase sigma-70 factor, ECF subfamily